MAKTGAPEHRGTVRAGASRKPANGEATTRKAATNGASTARKSSNGSGAPAKNGRALVDDPALARLEHALKAAAA